MKKENLLLLFAVMVATNYLFACLTDLSWIDAFKLSYTQATTMICVFINRKLINPQLTAQIAHDKEM